MDKNTHSLMEKWDKVLNIESAPKITDHYRKQVTAQLLENQLASMKAQRGQQVLAEDAYANVSGLGGEIYGAAAPASVAADGTAVPPVGNPQMAGFDPVLISLVRRAMPQLMAFDVCGVQPMAQPTGLIFAMKSRYHSQTGPEALYNEANTAWSGVDGRHIEFDEEGKLFGADEKGRHLPSMDDADKFNGEHEYGHFPDIEGLRSETHKVVDWATSVKTVEDGEFKGFPDIDLSAGYGMTTAAGEQLGNTHHNYNTMGDGTPEQTDWNQMAFSIEKTSVVAKTRVLKAEYTMELAQDLKSVHGIDAETELSNILATEILSEINREIVRDIYTTAEWGCRGGTARPGVFDLDVDSDGRWSAEKFKGLMYRIEREANAIGQRTRRGRGNFIICSADVASALQMAGMLDYAPAIQNNLSVDDTQSTFAGVLNGKYKVFVDPYTANMSDTQYCVVGYKGQSAYDAGMFYCPYVPLQLVKSIDPNSFQPKIGFKTRYGIAFNPMVQLDAGLGQGGDVAIASMKHKNYYYRKFLVTNL